MRLLLVHQNFPGQFRDLGPALCDRGHDLKAIGSSQRPSDPRIEVLRYEHQLGERSGMHPHSLEVDEWLHRSEQVAHLAMSLKQRGWAPDVMLVHPGWGEALLLRQVFASTPLVIWPELWLRPEHLGLDPASLNVGQMQYLRIKDWLIDGAMADASLAVLPTRYQASGRFGVPQNPRAVESRVLPLNPNPVDQPPLQIILMNRRFRNDSPAHRDPSVMNAIAVASHERMPIRQWFPLVQQSVGAGVRHKSNVIEIVGIERHAGWHSDASMLVVTTSTRLII